MSIFVTLTTLGTYIRRTWADGGQRLSGFPPFRELPARLRPVFRVTCSVFRSKGLTRAVQATAELWVASPDLSSQRAEPRPRQVDSGK